MREYYIVFNSFARKYRGRGDTFYTSNVDLARRFESRESAEEMCLPHEERVERTFNPGLGGYYA